MLSYEVGIVDRENLTAFEESIIFDRNQSFHEKFVLKCKAARVEIVLLKTLFPLWKGLWMV